jgi:sensor domain CHASE-containing protein
MTGLEQTFYIMAIIFMAISFLLLIALLSAVFIIKSKVNRIHDNIDKKLASITHLAEKSGEWAATASKIVSTGSKVAKKVKRK